jgi:hypothetical protein
MKTRRADRWKTCLHEAAHIVTARALNGWDCEASASIRADGNSGTAVFPYGLSAFDYAVAVAAGEHAERLPFDAPKRRRRLPLPPAETAEGIRARAVRVVQAEVAETSHRGAMADCETVARYSISLHPGEPSEWVAAHARVHDAAKRLTWEHRDTIRAVALTLFHRGSVTLPGDPAHEEYFAGGAVAVDQ